MFVLLPLFSAAKLTQKIVSAIDPHIEGLRSRRGNTTYPRNEPKQSIRMQSATEERRSAARFQLQVERGIQQDGAFRPEGQLEGSCCLFGRESCSRRCILCEKTEDSSNDCDAGRYTQYQTSQCLEVGRICGSQWSGFRCCEGGMC